MIILYQQEDKSVAILNTASNVSIERILRLEDIPRDSQYMIIEEEELPPEHYLANFFSALRADFQGNSPKKIWFDVNVARQLTKDRLRKERTLFFTKNDIEIRDAQIENNSVKLQKAIAERDRLRNLPNIVNDISDLDQLINLHP